MRWIAIAVWIACAWTPAWSDGLHYVRWQDVQPFLARFTAAGEKTPEFADRDAWSRWVWDRDIGIRGRIDHGVEDSISALIVFGTSFTNLPRLASAAEAVNAAGDLTANAHARLEAFVQALDEQDSERLAMTLEFLRRRRVTEEELRAFLGGNLRRFAIEGAAGQQKHAQGREYTDEGISPESSFRANFAIAEALGTLKSNNALPGKIRRIAVIGPGLSIAGEAPGYDFCPPQSVQPLAVLDAVLRQSLAQPAEVQVTAIDLNPYVLAHLRTAKARGGQHYTIQLARQRSAEWSPAAVEYWQHFGDTIGAAGTPASAQSGMEFRAVNVKQQFFTRISVEELNVVVQSREPGAGFDLVVATNVLTYYSPFEQALTLMNIAGMMSHGGILVTDSSLPVQKVPELEGAGTSFAPFLADGSGESLAMFRRR